MYAENREALLPSLDELVERGDVDGLLREIRKAVVAMALNSDPRRQAELVSELQQIVDVVRAGTEKSG